MLDLENIIEWIKSKTDSNITSIESLESAVSSIQTRLDKLEPTILYSLPNPIPSPSANITLNGNISNYKYLEFYIYGASWYLTSNKIYIGNGSPRQIQISYNTNGGGIVSPCGTCWTISGKTMSHNYSYRIGLYGSAQGYESSTPNNFLLILGYKQKGNTMKQKMFKKLIGGGYEYLNNPICLYA